MLTQIAMGAGGDFSQSAFQFPYIIATSGDARNPNTPKFMLPISTDGNGQNQMLLVQPMIPTSTATSNSSFNSRNSTPKSTYEEQPGSSNQQKSNGETKIHHSSGKNKLTLEALAEVASQPEKYNTTNAYVKSERPTTQPEEKNLPSIPMNDSNQILLATSNGMVIGQQGTPVGSQAPINMDDQEKKKLERKRQRNRDAAQRCRMRKLERIANLEKEVEDIKKALAQKQNELDYYKPRCEKIVKLVNAHIYRHEDSVSVGDISEIVKDPVAFQVDQKFIQQDAKRHKPN